MNDVCNNIDDYKRKGKGIILTFFGDTIADIIDS